MSIERPVRCACINKPLHFKRIVDFLAQADTGIFKET
jgi:hypothetical protein